MSLTPLTPENAPRDSASLLEKGRYQIRQLAGKLGLTSTPEQNTAFTSMKVEDQAKELERVLKAYDAQGGTGSASPPAAAETPSTELKRTPRNSAAKEEKATPSGDGGQILEEIAKLFHNDKNFAEQLTSLHKKVDEVKELLSTSISLNLILAEQVLGAGRGDILKTAMDDVADVLGSLLGKGRKK